MFKTNITRQVVNVFLLERKIYSQQQPLPHLYLSLYAYFTDWWILSIFFTLTTWKTIGTYEYKYTDENGCTFCTFNDNRSEIHIPIYEYVQWSLFLYQHTSAFMIYDLQGNRLLHIKVVLHLSQTGWLWQFPWCHVVFCIDASCSRWHIWNQQATNRQPVEWIVEVSADKKDQDKVALKGWCKRWWYSKSLHR